MASKDTDPETLDFADVLRDLGHGSTNRQGTKLLREVLAACEETQGKGKIVLTISVETNGGIAAIAASAKATIPQPKLPGGSYYVTKDGGLVTEDPRQLTLGARVLEMKGIKNGGNVS